MNLAQLCDNRDDDDDDDRTVRSECSECSAGTKYGTDSPHKIEGEGRQKEPHCLQLVPVSLQRSGSPFLGSPD